MQRQQRRSSKHGPSSLGQSGKQAVLAPAAASALPSNQTITLDEAFNQAATTRQQRSAQPLPPTAVGAVCGQPLKIGQRLWVQEQEGAQPALLNQSPSGGERGENLQRVGDGGSSHGLDGSSTGKRRERHELSSQAHGRRAVPSPPLAAGCRSPAPAPAPAGWRWCPWLCWSQTGTPTLPAAAGPAPPGCPAPPRCPRAACLHGKGVWVRRQQRVASGGMMQTMQLGRSQPGHTIEVDEGSFDAAGQAASAVGATACTAHGSSCCGCRPHCKVPGRRCRSCCSAQRTARPREQRGPLQTVLASQDCWLADPMSDHINVWGAIKTKRQQGGRWWRRRRRQRSRQAVRWGCVACLPGHSMLHDISGI